MDEEAFRKFIEKMAEEDDTLLHRIWWTGTFNIVNYKGEIIEKRNRSKN